MFLNSSIIKGSILDDWSEIAAEDLRDYVCDVFSELKPSSVGRYITSLRNFFRFLEYSGSQVNQSVLELPLFYLTLTKEMASDGNVFDMNT